MPLLLFSLVLDFGLILYTITRSDRKRSFHLSILAIFVFVYTLGYLIEIRSDSLEVVIAALSIENFGIPFIAPFVLLSILGLFWSPLLRKWHLTAALVYGFAMSLIVLTNPYHHLYYPSITMVNVDGSQFAVLSHGPFYFLQQSISGVLLLIAFILLFSRFSKSSPKQRRMMLYILVSAVFATSANIIHISGLLPAGLDPTPFALSLSVGLFTLALCKSNLTDIIQCAMDIALETMKDAIVVFDEDGAFLQGNLAARKLFPQLNALTENTDITEIAGWPRELDCLTEQADSSLAIADMRYRVDVHRMLNAKGKFIGWSVIFKDVTDIMNLMEQLEQRASTDTLTGILNRGKFCSAARLRLFAAQQRGEAASLILFDIDWFKQVNDTYGHPAGDAVLQRTTTAIQEKLRAYDLFGRLGGEEFVIFVSGLTDEQVCKLIERLRLCIAQTKVEYEQNQLSVTASFGIASITPDMTFEQALHNADAAMYAAKRQGRNCVMRYQDIIWDE